MPVFWALLSGESPIGGQYHVSRHEVQIIGMTRSLIDELSEQLGVQMRAAREAAGFTQEQAGQVIYKSRQRVQRIESGENPPNAIEYAMLMNAYRLDVSLPLDLISLAIALGSE